MADDTANEVAPLGELLHSAECRVKIARMLLASERWDLLPTVLEDLHYGTQMMMDKHCVSEEVCDVP